MTGSYEYCVTDSRPVMTSASLKPYWNCIRSMTWPAGCRKTLGWTTHFACFEDFFSRNMIILMLNLLQLISFPKWLHERLSSFWVKASHIVSRRGVQRRTSRDGREISAGLWLASSEGLQGDCLLSEMKGFERFSTNATSDVCVRGWYL